MQSLDQHSTSHGYATLTGDMFMCVYEPFGPLARFCSCLFYVVFQCCWLVCERSAASCSPYI